VRLTHLNRFGPRRFHVLRISAVIALLILSPCAVKVVDGAAWQDAPAQAKINPQKTAPASGQISGHVYRADTSEPLAKCEVGLIPVSGSNFNAVGQKRFTTTDGAGVYAFTQVGPGNYLIYGYRKNELEW